MILDKSKEFLLVTLVLVCLLAFELSLGDCVQEDAYISFRYARNLSEGEGLVFNPGERVEGYTNFLWVLIAAAGIEAGIDPNLLVRVLGICFSLALGLLVFFWARKDASRTGGFPALIVFCFAPYMAVEAVEGLETLFYSFLVALGCFLSIEGRREPGWNRSLALGSIVLFLAALTRPEGVLVAACIFLGAAIWRVVHKHPFFPWAELSAGALFLLPYLAYWLWRLDYYGYPFPNTFYCKTGGGLRHAALGLGYVGLFFIKNPAIAVFVLLAIAAWWKKRKNGARKIDTDRTGGFGVHAGGYILFTLIAGYLGWIVSIGGDFKETFRFLVPLLPLAAVAIERTLSSERASPLLLAGTEAEKKMLFRILLALFVLNAAISLPGSLKWAGERRDDLFKRTLAGKWLAANAPPDAVLAIHSAGVIPYFSGLRTIDMWGVNNIHIAHTPIPADSDELVGHEKSDDYYVFGKRPTYFVDENYYMTSKPMLDLKAMVFTAEQMILVAPGYRVRNMIIMAEGKTLFFNFLERSR